MLNILKEHEMVPTKRLKSEFYEYVDYMSVKLNKLLKKKKSKNKTLI